MFNKLALLSKAHKLAEILVSQTPSRPITDKAVHITLTVNNIKILKNKYDYSTHRTVSPSTATIRFISFWRGLVGDLCQCQHSSTRIAYKHILF